MAQTYIGSTLRTGTDALSDTTDGGYVVTLQTGTVTTVAAGTAVSTSFTLPASSQIVNFFIDQVVDEVVGGGSATAINATVGTAAAGTQYLSATNVISGGRAATTFTAAQLLAMSNIGTTTSVYFTIAPNGTISTTQGVYRITVVYAQKV
jgi:hypothetical protein